MVRVEVAVDLWPAFEDVSSLGEEAAGYVGSVEEVNCSPPPFLKLKVSWNFVFILPALLVFLRFSFLGHPGLHSQR